MHGKTNLLQFDLSDGSNSSLPAKTESTEAVSEDTAFSRIKRCCRAFVMGPARWFLSHCCSSTLHVQTFGLPKIPRVKAVTHSDSISCCSYRSGSLPHENFELAQAMAAGRQVWATKGLCFDGLENRSLSFCLLAGPGSNNRPSDFKPARPPTLRASGGCEGPLGHLKRNSASPATCPKTLSPRSGGGVTQSGGHSPLGKTHRLP